MSPGDIPRLSPKKLLILLIFSAAPLSAAFKIVSIVVPLVNLTVPLVLDAYPVMASIHPFNLSVDKSLASLSSPKNCFICDKSNP